MVIRPAVVHGVSQSLIVTSASSSGIVVVSPQSTVVPGITSQTVIGMLCVLCVCVVIGGVLSPVLANTTTTSVIVPTVPATVVSDQSGIIVIV